MDITAQQLVANVLTANQDKWGYVLSGNGEMYSKSTAEYWAKTRNKPSTFKGTPYDYYVVGCARWFGHRVADCSGLIVACVRMANPKYADTKANTFYSQSARKGAISTIPEIPGLGVWKSGHTGVYVGNGKVVESRGYKYGVVITNLKSRPWTNWYEIRGVDYSAQEVNEVINKFSGEAVIKEAQETMIFLGFKGGMDESKLGQWGSKTESALGDFQASVNLPRKPEIDAECNAAMMKALREKAAKAEGDFAYYMDRVGSYKAGVVTAANIKII